MIFGPCNEVFRQVFFGRPLELIGFNDITRTAKNYESRYKVEAKLTQWVQNYKHILIAGHNHPGHTFLK